MSEILKLNKRIIYEPFGSKSVATWQIKYTCFFNFILIEQRIKIFKMQILSLSFFLISYMIFSRTVPPHLFNVYTSFLCSNIAYISALPLRGILYPVGIRQNFNVHVDVYRRLILTQRCDGDRFSGAFSTRAVCICRMGRPGGSSCHLGNNHCTLYWAAKVSTLQTTKLNQNITIIMSCSFSFSMTSLLVGVHIIIMRVHQNLLAGFIFVQMLA